MLQYTHTPTKAQPDLKNVLLSLSLSPDVGNAADGSGSPGVGLEDSSSLCTLRPVQHSKVGELKRKYFHCLIEIHLQHPPPPSLSLPLFLPPSPCRVSLC